MVIREGPTQIQGQGTSGHAQALTEQEEAVRRPVAVQTVVGGETVTRLDRFSPLVLSPGVEELGLVVTALAVVELRLEEDRGIVGELVVQADTHAVTVVALIARVLRLLDLGVAIKIVFLITLLHGLGIGTAVHVVA